MSRHNSMQSLPDEMVSRQSSRSSVSGALPVSRLTSLAQSLEGEVSRQQSASMDCGVLKQGSGYSTLGELPQLPEQPCATREVPKFKVKAGRSSLFMPTAKEEMQVRNRRPCPPPPVYVEWNVDSRTLASERCFVSSLTPDRECHRRGRYSGDAEAALRSRDRSPTARDGAEKVIQLGRETPSLGGLAGFKFFQLERGGWSALNGLPKKSACPRLSCDKRVRAR